MQATPSSTARAAIAPITMPAIAPADKRLLLLLPTSDVLALIVALFVVLAGLGLAVADGEGEGDGLGLLDGEATREGEGAAALARMLASDVAAHNCSDHNE